MNRWHGMTPDLRKSPGTSSVFLPPQSGWASRFCAQGREAALWEIGTLGQDTNTNQTVPLAPEKQCLICRTRGNKPQQCRQASFSEEYRTQWPWTQVYVLKYKTVHLAWDQKCKIHKLYSANSPITLKQESLHLGCRYSSLHAGHSQEQNYIRTVFPHLQQ